MTVYDTASVRANKAGVFQKIISPLYTAAKRAAVPMQCMRHRIMSGTRYIHHLLRIDCYKLNSCLAISCVM